MWQSWPMIYNTGGLWCATRWFADQMCSWGKKKCTAQLNLPTINNLFLTQLLSEAMREQALFLWLDESCKCALKDQKQPYVCIQGEWAVLQKICQDLPRLHVITSTFVDWMLFLSITCNLVSFLTPKWKETAAPKYAKTYVCCRSNIDKKYLKFHFP